MPDLLHLACTLHFHQPTGVGPQALDRAFDGYYDVVLDVIEEDPNLRLNLHLTGTILEHALARRPAFIDRLRTLWKQDRVEVLGGAFHDPVLPAIPERDALGQIQYTSSFLQTHLERRPEGAWLCLRAWDTGLIRTLAGAGTRYTLLDDAQFVVAGLQPATIRGHFTTEHNGHTLGVFPIDATLVHAVSSQDRETMRDTLEVMAQRQAGSQGVEVFAGDGEKLMDEGRLGDFLSVLRSEFHWVKTYLLETAFRVFPSQGRVYLPTSAQPELGDWSRPAEHVARHRSFMRQMQAMGVQQEAEQFGGGVVFDHFLVKYPEVNQLHKRMLRASRRVDQLRNVLLERKRSGRSGEGDKKACAVLQKACAALWRSQNHSAYWHGGELNEGLYNPILRQRAQRELMQAESAVDRVLSDRKGERWLALRGDHDADGADEVMVVTPQFGAIVNPGFGGTLWELDLRKHNLPLLTSVGAVEEPYHQAFAGHEVALVFEGDEDDATLPPVPGEAPEAQPALHNLALDRLPRGFFQDHFLAPETTLESFARRQFRELGDFATEPFELVQVNNKTSDGSEPGLVSVGRSGVVKDLHNTMLLRVEKSYRFEISKPRLELSHALTNRSRDSASVWHGLEWTFGVPSAKSDSVSIRAVGEGAERTANLSDGPVDLGEAAWVEWVDEAARIAVVLEFDRPLRLWWVPVRTVHQAPGGWQDVIQGHTLLAHRPCEIWGQESAELSIRMDFLPT